MSKFLKSILFSSTLLAGCTLMADDLPEPFASIHKLSPTPYWFQNGYLLLDKVTAESTTIFIDVGSQSGSAARLVAQNIPNVKIYNIDIWQSCDPSQKNLYQKFLSNLIEERTTERIIPIRMTSLEAAKALNITAEVIYLDSTEQSLSAEILAWSAHLAQNGTICGQGWSEASVQFSVAQAANKLGFLVRSNEDFWHLERN